MEAGEPGPPPAGVDSKLTEDEKSWVAYLSKRIKFLNKVVIGLGAILLASGSVVAGDQLDPLQLGREAPIAASFTTTQTGRFYTSVNAEHDYVVKARVAPGAQDDDGQDDGDAPTSCESEIRSELAPETALSIEFDQDAAEAIPNVHQEHYIAVTRQRHVTYLCTTVLIPYTVKVVPTGLARRQADRAAAAPRD